MAIIKCPECGQEISDQSRNCIHCGYPLKKQKGTVLKEHRNKILAVGAVFLGICAVIVLITFFLNRNSSKAAMHLADKTAAVFQSESDREKQLVTKKGEDFVSLVITGQIDETQKYLDKPYDYLGECIYSFTNMEALKTLLSKYTAVFQETTVDTEQNLAYCKFEVNHPNPEELINAQRDSIHLGMEDDTLTNALLDKLEDSSLTYVTDDVFINFHKIDGEWKVITDSTLYSFINLGRTVDSTIESLSDNEKKMMETENYIEEYIELNDFLVSECEGYSGKVPGIKNVSLKNNGDKKITALSLKLEFLNAEGNVAETKKVTVIGMMDGPIKPGYSWKMESDKFFEIKGLRDDIDITKVNVSIGDVTLSDSAEASVKSREEEYIENYLELNDYKVDMCQSYSGTFPGLENVSIKNNGDRDLRKVTVTVYFQDAQGKNIAEDSFTVIGSLFSSSLLKANYSWKMEPDKFYEIKNLADEVDISRYTVEITGIEFN